MMKNFRMGCLLIAIFTFSILPMTTYAKETYNADDAGILVTGMTIQAGDTIQFVYSDQADFSGVTYYDVEETSSLSVTTDELTANLNNGDSCTIAVKSYSSCNFSTISANAFKEWKITDIQRTDDGKMSHIDLTAVPYNTIKVSYELDGGTNNSQNLSLYYEGKEDITFYPPTKEGFDFIKWEMINSDGNRVDVSSIPTEEQEILGGHIFLYAIFEPKTLSVTTPTPVPSGTPNAMVTVTPKPTALSKTTDSDTDSNNEDLDNHSPSSGTTDDDGPDTGDTVQTGIALSFMILSGMGIVLINQKKKTIN